MLKIPLYVYIFETFRNSVCLFVSVKYCVPTFLCVFRRQSDVSRHVAPTTNCRPSMTRPAPHSSLSPGKMTHATTGLPSTNRPVSHSSLSPGKMTRASTGFSSKKKHAPNFRQFMRSRPWQVTHPRPDLHQIHSSHNPAFASSSLSPGNMVHATTGRPSKTRPTSISSLSPGNVAFPIPELTHFPSWQ